MIGVTFALPQESKTFRSQLHHIAADGSHEILVANLGPAEIALAHIGIGFAAATPHVRSLLAAYPLNCLICTGFAGGLDRQLSPGDLVISTNYSAPQLVDICRRVMAGNPRTFFGALTSEPEPAETAAAKTRLAIRTGALAVDMETAAVAEECASAGVPLLAIRVISDAARTGLPVPMEQWFDLNRQRPRAFRLLFFLATHHASIGPFMRFVSSLPRMRRILARTLTDIIEAAERARVCS